MQFFLFLLIVALLGALVGAYFFNKVSRWYRGRKIRHRFEKGIQAESGLESLLVENGYEVVDLQPRVHLEAYIDGESKRYLVRPDALARRGEQLFWVEMKSGTKATNPLSTHTRRQLMEYYYCTGETPVLFVNAEEGTVQEVSFGQAIMRSVAPVEVSEEQAGFRMREWMWGLGVGMGIGAGLQWIIR